MVSSHYYLPAAIKEVNRIKFAHMDTAQMEINQSSHVGRKSNQVVSRCLEGVRNTIIEKVKDLEICDILRDFKWNSIDHNFYTFDLISESKRRTSSK